MTAQKRKNNRKWLWWGTGILILVIVVGGGVLIWQKNQADDKKNVNTTVVEKEEKKNIDNETEKTTEPAETVSTGVEKEKVVQYEGEDPNTEAELSGVVTYAGVSGEKLMIRVSIDQYLTGGQCELNLIKDGTVIYDDTVNITSSASTSTCEGFDVSASGLGANGATGAGKIEIKIKINADGRSGVIGGEVEI